MPETITLYRPVGPKELELIKQSDWAGFPPRLPQQPIFYPVLNEEYASQIARDWNVKASGSGFVTKFEVDKKYIEQFEIQTVGGQIHKELWIPAAELENFNKHIIGKIEVIKAFYPETKVFVYKVQLLRCCSKSKSSNTLVCCGLNFSHASNLNFIEQTLDIMDRY